MPRFCWEERKYMEAYAVIETGGKQYRVQKGSVLDVEHLEGDVGSNVQVSRVLALSNGEALRVGTPEVEGGSVTVSIVQQFRGEKLIAFRKKRRKGYHKKKGHRQELTRIKVDAISA
jgi:large subunit ribosomal protein L21